MTAPWHADPLWDSSRVPPTSSAAATPAGSSLVHPHPSGFPLLQLTPALDVSRVSPGRIAPARASRPQQRFPASDIRKKEVYEGGEEWIGQGS